MKKSVSLIIVPLSLLMPLLSNALKQSAPLRQDQEQVEIEKKREHSVIAKKIPVNPPSPDLAGPKVRVNGLLPQKQIDPPPFAPNLLPLPFDADNVQQQEVKQTQTKLVRKKQRKNQRGSGGKQHQQTGTNTNANAGRANRNTNNRPNGGDNKKAKKVHENIELDNDWD